MAKPPPRPIKKKACVFCREEVEHIDLLISELTALRETRAGLL